MSSKHKYRHWLDIQKRCVSPLNCRQWALWYHLNYEYPFIWIQVLFLIYSVCPWITVTECQDVWNIIMKSCMWMSSRALLSSCRPWYGDRQARAMMSTSLANKLWLTLWGPWRKGNGMEWECAVVMLQDSTHRRCEAMVMLAERGGESSWILCKGEGQMAAATGINVEDKKVLIQMTTSNRHDFSIFVSDPREKPNNLALFHVEVLSFPSAKQKSDNKKNTTVTTWCCNISKIFFPWQHITNCCAFFFFF